MPHADLIPAPEESPLTAHDRVARELLDELAESRGGLIVSNGPPGTRDNPFFQALARAADERGDAVHLGNADEFERSIAMSFLERFAARNSWADEYVATAIRDSDPIAFARHTIDHLLQHDADNATQQHVVMITDAQWIDDESAKALRFMLPRLIYRGVILVFSVAYGKSTPFVEHLLDLAEHDAHGRYVEPPMLRPTDVRRHFESRFGFTLGVESCRRVVEWSSGMLADADLLFDEITDDELAAIRESRTIPHDVMERAAAFATAPLDLDPELRVYAEICSAVFGTIGRDSFTRVCRRLGVLENLNAALIRGVVVHRSNGDVTLATPRSYQAVIDGAPPERLRRIQQALADEGVGLVAAHRLLAIDSPTRADYDDARAAARELDRSGRYREASIVYRSAQMRADDPEIESEVLREGLSMHIRRRIRFESDNFLGDVDRLVPEPARTHLRLWAAHLSRLGDDHEWGDQIAFYTAPTESVEHQWLQLDIALLHAMNAHALGDREVANRALDAARRLTDGLHDPPPEHYWWMSATGRRLIIEAISLCPTLHSTPPGNLASQLESVAERALQLPTDSADRACALAICGTIGFFEADSIRAHGYATEASTACATAAASCPFSGDATVVVALGAIHDGEWALADAVLTEALPHAFASVEPRTRATMPMVASYLWSARGELERARVLIEAAREQIDRTTALGGFGDFMVIAECEFAMHTDGIARVIELTDEHLAAGRFVDAFGLHLYRTEAFALLGDGEAAMASLEKCRETMRGPFLDHPGFLEHAEGAARRAAGDLEGAEAALRRGIADSSAPLEIAKCELTLARTLGATDEALLLLSAAEARLTEIGATTYLRFVRSVRNEIIGTKRDRVAALTSREVQIANLAANNWTNPEIARELGISRSTVAFHISKVLEKLRLSSRRDIAGALRSAGG